MRQSAFLTTLPPLFVRISAACLPILQGIAFGVLESVVDSVKRERLILCQLVSVYVVFVEVVSRHASHNEVESTYIAYSSEVGFG